ncbi:hypothetical protein CEXT_364191 [Caerostris extrusa]|uniref:Uncharacterized protein n=1 Tax=Caerostris extrusa TaxID=172846 RepID=A0AAV4SL47_CAEEX|nr:hypothetical protein CEXT_364191 [Caerostris extrusa]
MTTVIFMKDEISYITGETVRWPTLLEGLLHCKQLGMVYEKSTPGASPGAGKPTPAPGDPITGDWAMAKGIWCRKWRLLRERGEHEE